MTDSVDNSPSARRRKKTFLEKVNSGEIQRVLAKDKQEIHELPRWVKTALVFKTVDGMSYNEAAKRVGKTGSTLNDYAKSPAAKKWLESLVAFVEDPVEMAKAYISANALSVSLERFAFLEAAVAAGDYKEGDKIARDLQDRMGIITKKQESGQINLTVKLGGGGLDIPIVEAQVIEDD